jgi:shikimate kinase
VLIILIGPKGSGKSHIGRLLERELGVHFFHVEPHWMAFQDECRKTGIEPDIPTGIRRIHPLIADALAKHSFVCVETTGASNEILDDLLSFGEHGQQLLVNVRAPLSLCLNRIAERDPTEQIPLSPAEIEKVHALSSAVALPFDIVLENTSLDEDEILASFRDRIAR